MTRTHTTLGDLISVCYEEFLAMYGDEELASIATAAVINDLLTANEGARAAPEEAA
ncbi:MAG: hypothetical protein ACOZNI_37280 [Myxococcota bacterium]